MRIVMICDFFGDDQQYQENLLAKYYVKHGHSVTIVTSTIENVFDYINNKYKKNKVSKTYYYNGIKIIRLPYKYNILNKLRKFPNVQSILDEEEPNLIFMHECFANLKEAARYKKNNASCKIIMDYHADHSNSGKNWVSINILHKVLRKSLLYGSLSSIDKIYPIVPSGFKFLNEIYNIPYHHMELLPLGVDTDMANEIINNTKTFKIREKLGIQENDFVVFTGGKFSPLKQTHLIIKAVVNINNPKMHLVVVGDASDVDKEYKEFLEKVSDNSKFIHFVGWLNSVDVYKYMNACDIAVFPSSQSVLWQQSIGMELPLIIGRYVTLENGKTIEQDVDYLNIHNNVIPLNEINEKQIENVILDIMGNKELLNKMKEGARKASREFLSYDVIAERTLR